MRIWGAGLLTFAVRAWLAVVACAVLAADGSALTIVLLTENNGSLTAEETARQTFLQGLGHTVNTLWDGSTQSAYDAALTTADVVYISEESSAADIGYKLRTATVGVVSEDPEMDAELGFSSADGAELAGTQINVVDPAFGAGLIAIFSSSQPEIHLQGTPAIGFHTVAQLPGGQRALGIIEANSPLANTYNGNSTASGRRLRLPWGGAAFAFGSLNSTGRTLLQMGVAWVGEKSLILHWKLDESAGTTASDSSTYSRHGTVNGAGSWATAVRHRGLSASGAGNVSVAGLLNNQPYFSLAAWVKITAHDASGTDVISLGDRVVLRATSTALQGVFYNGSSYPTVSYNTAIADTGWRHVALTFDRAADSMKLYLDGALVATRTETTSAVYTGGGANTVVGAHGNGNTAYDLNGSIDDVRIYNKPLSDQEVRELYGLMGHYRLDENAGTVAADSSGNANDGTITGAPGMGKTGVYAGAFGFSDVGAADRVSIPNAVANKLTSVSVSFWIKSTHTGEQAILSGNPPAGDNELLIFFGSATQIRTYFHAVQTSWTTPSVADGKWTHFVVVSSAEANTTTIYRNGVSLGTQATSAGGSAFNIAAGGLIIGQEQDSVGGGFAASQRLIGDLDELRVYNRALQPQEIADLYGSVGHWKFDEGAGLAIADSSPAAQHASVSNGAPAWTTAVRNSGMAFGGAPDAAITDNKFTPPSTGTVAFWFKRTAALGGRERPFGLGGDWEAWQDPDGIMRFDLACDGEQGDFKTLTALADIGRWYHVAAVFDAATDAYQIYIDGQLHRSGVSTRDITIQAAARLSFGTRTGAVEHFGGALDDFRVYNRKLTAAEISELYGLVAWYKLDETSGTVAADSTGLGNNGVYAGSPVLGVTSTGGSSMGTAAQFTGANSVQVAKMFGNPASITASAWVRLNAADSAGADVVSLGDHFVLRVSPSGAGVTAVYYNGTSWVSAPVAAPLGVKWRHLAATFTTGGTIAVYIDGQQAATLAAGSISYSGLGQNTRIATHGNGGSSYDLSGVVDDVRIYDRALATDEMYRLYRGGRINGLRVLSWVEVR
jgi:hypothetical protein